MKTLTKRVGNRAKLGGVNGDGAGREDGRGGICYPLKIGN